MGDAFREESLTRRVSYDTSPSYSNSSEQNIDELDRLVLMGIVSTSDLRHAELLKGTQVIFLLTCLFKGFLKLVKKYFILRKL